LHLLRRTGLVSPTAPASADTASLGLPMVALKPMCVVLARRRWSTTACEEKKNTSVGGSVGPTQRSVRLPIYINLSLSLSLALARVNP